MPGMRSALLWSALVTAACASVDTRRSDVVPEATAAWQEPGFRVRLAADYGRLVPSEDEPAAASFGITLQPGYRVSPWWSLASSFRYAVLTGDLEGLRWTATLDPSFHPFTGATVSVGAGYAGLIAARTDPWMEDYPYDFRTCEGEGWAALARAGWEHAFGELFALGLAAQADVQWSRCSFTGDVDVPLGGRSDDGFTQSAFVPLTLTERWRHTGLSLGLTFTWR